MQNSQIVTLPAKLLKRVNLFSGPPGVVAPNEQGVSIYTHRSPIMYHGDPGTYATAADVVGSTCPSCQAMGKEMVEIPIDMHLPYIGVERE